MYKSLSIGSTTSIYTSTHLRCMNRRKCEITTVQLGFNKSSSGCTWESLPSKSIGWLPHKPSNFLVWLQGNPNKFISYTIFLPICSIFGETLSEPALCKTNNDNIQQINTNSSISLIKILNPTTAEDKRLKIRIYLRRWSWRRPGETCRVLLLVPLVGSENLEWQVMEGQLWMKGGVPSLGTNISLPQGMLEDDVPVLVWWDMFSWLEGIQKSLIHGQGRYELITPFL